MNHKVSKLKEYLHILSWLDDNTNLTYLIEKSLILLKIQALIGFYTLKSET